MDWEKWHSEAKRAGQYYWAYAEFVDDNPDGADAAWKAGMDPFDYIKSEGESLDLHRFTEAWI